MKTLANKKTQQKWGIRDIWIIRASETVSKNDSSRVFGVPCPIVTMGAEVGVNSLAFRGKMLKIQCRVSTQVTAERNDNDLGQKGSRD